MVDDVLNVFIFYNVWHCRKMMAKKNLHIVPRLVRYGTWYTPFYRSFCGPTIVLAKVFIFVRIFVRIMALRMRIFVEVCVLRMRMRISQNVTNMYSCRPLHRCLRVEDGLDIGTWMKVEEISITEYSLRSFPYYRPLPLSLVYFGIRQNKEAYWLMDE
jgi:hypothetical protein